MDNAACAANVDTSVRLDTVWKFNASHHSYDRHMLNLRQEGRWSCVTEKNEELSPGATSSTLLTAVTASLGRIL